MTEYRLGSAWQVPDPPEPTEEDHALNAFLKGETDDLDPALARARMLDWARRLAVIEQQLRGAAERMQAYAAAELSSGDMPTRAVEQYASGFVAGRIDAATACSQVVRDILNMAAEGES